MLLELSSFSLSSRDVDPSGAHCGKSRADGVAIAYHANALCAMRVFACRSFGRSRVCVYRCRLHGDCLQAHADSVYTNTTEHAFPNSVADLDVPSL